MTVNQRLMQITEEYSRLVLEALDAPLLEVSKRLKEIEIRLKALREERDELMQKYPRNQRWRTL